MRGRYSNYAVYCDVDGTLTNSEGIVSEENKAAVKRFTEEGGKFSIASGRSPENVKKLGLKINAPCIFRNGAVIEDIHEHRILRSVFMPDGALEMACRLYEMFPDAGIVICTEKDYQWLRRGPYYKDVPLEKEDMLVSADQLESGMPVYIVSVSGKNHEDAEVKRFVEHEYPQFYAYSSYPGFIDITSFETSKGECLKILAKNDTRISIACGDGENDIGMIRNADYGIAVGNACDVLKMNADFVIQDRDHHAMVQILQMINEGKFDRKACTSDVHE